MHPPPELCSEMRGSKLADIMQMPTHTATRGPLLRARPPVHRTLVGCAAAERNSEVFKGWWAIRSGGIAAVQTSQWLRGGSGRVRESATARQRDSATARQRDSARHISYGYACNAKAKHANRGRMRGA